MKVLFCVPGESFSDIWLKSWTWTLSVLQSEGISFALSNATGSDVVDVRHKVAGGNVSKGQHQVPFEEHDHDTTFWIDSDMVWKPSDVLALLDHPHEVVSGLYTNARGEPNAYTAPLVRVEPGEGLQEAYGVGFGFIKVDREVFSRLPYPWFNRMPNDSGGTDSEDISFCRRAREAGYKVWVDRSIVVGHEKRCIVSTKGITGVY